MSDETSPTTSSQSNNSVAEATTSETGDHNNGHQTPEAGSKQKIAALMAVDQVLKELPRDLDRPLLIPLAGSGPGAGAGLAFLPGTIRRTNEVLVPRETPANDNSGGRDDDDGLVRISAYRARQRLARRIGRLQRNGGVEEGRSGGRARSNGDDKHESDAKTLSQTATQMAALTSASTTVASSNVNDGADKNVINNNDGDDDDDTAHVLSSIRGQQPHNDGSRARMVSGMTLNLDNDSLGQDFTSLEHSDEIRSELIHNADGTITILEFSPEEDSERKSLAEGIDHRKEFPRARATQSQHQPKQSPQQEKGEGAVDMAVQIGAIEEASSSKDPPSATQLSAGHQQQDQLALLREQGNSAFQKSEFQHAIDCYSQCLSIVRKSMRDTSKPASPNVAAQLHVLLTNRAAAYVGLRKWSWAIKDSTDAIIQNPRYTLRCACQCLPRLFLCPMQTASSTRAFVHGVRQVRQGVSSPCPSTDRSRTVAGRSTHVRESSRNGT